MQQIKNKRAFDALLDEYERTIRDLKHTLANITPQMLTTVADHVTEDPDCKSVQTVLAHVVRSGYAYAIYVRNWQGEQLQFPEPLLLNSVEAYYTALDNMLTYNIQVFADYPNMPLEEMDNDRKIRTNWGQLYDIEQLFEHAIVHILRHRRQIERFLLVLNENREKVDNF